MTVNALIKSLEEYKDKGSGNVEVFAVPDTRSHDISCFKNVCFVSFHGIHNGKFLNIILGTKEIA